MTIISAVIQGLIQGFTEFLPVSSSGHLSLYQYFTGINSESSMLFSVLLHFGTFLAVVAAFFPTIVSLLRELFGILADLFTLRIFKRGKGRVTPSRRMMYLLMLSCVPLLAVLLFKDQVESFSTDNDILMEGICFLFTALLLTIADRCPKGRRTAVNQTVGGALGIGIAQCIATLPGVSRSGSTISAGLICGLDRGYAVEYSFILGLPAILAAGVLELRDLGAVSGPSLNLGVALIGMLVAAVAGFLSIKLVSYLVKSDKFRIFAWYTMILGIVVVAIAIVERFTGHAVQQMISSLL